ncbi:helix-turn-helix domain-containing protein [Peribacillus loiseleuriae]|uniref:HTH cro/C1-type domain-containing protein n=1 Tax=Peribacillus loiseleuriae TaxID=1679170 RepID=A0A0K9GR77_9BACI|nr:helix-turn-helix transcriptional regulator [Peribacillus loiseleuriae]KMY49199.1 hypothetical protein AC625_06415 [Peribacillus loiseleuriae]
MDTGEIIVELREKRNWSQRELARRANLNSSVMNRIETGDRPIKAIELKIFADLFGVTTDFLLNRTKEQHQQRVSVSGQEITLSPEEFKIFEELKKYPILFHDLATDPEKKVKELIKLQKAKKLFLEDDDEKYGDGFGDFED